MTVPLLQVRSLNIGFARNDDVRNEQHIVDALTNISFQIQAGETLALLGESGCGKSLAALALMRLLPPEACVQSGHVLLADGSQARSEDVLRVPESRMRQIRGRQMAMIFQEPATSLNPVMRIGAQIAEAVRLHRSCKESECQHAVLSLIDQVGLPDPEKIAHAYPFELSGGMKQRAMIAMALAGNPSVLIADEPTTALDVTLQAQILDLLQSLQRQRRMGLLLITHDLAVVSSRADRVAVMYAGQIVETGQVSDVLRQPLHPYTQALLAALPENAHAGQPLVQIPGRVPPLGTWPLTCRFAPRCERQDAHCLVEAPPWVLLPGDDSHEAQHRVLCWRVGEPDVRATRAEIAAASASVCGLSESEAEAAPTLSVQNLSVRYQPLGSVWLRRALQCLGQVRAEGPPVVDNINFAVNPGETLAIVGESGCGKTTVARAILQLLPIAAGEVVINGQTVMGGLSRPDKLWRRDIQMVFQDPFASLDPRQRIGHILAEGPRALQLAPDTYSQEALCRLLDRVGLAPESLDRFPHEFSGGQRQRIAIARALAVSPKVLICDEPTSALDVSVQASILNLLKTLQAETGIAIVFITHNFGVVRYLADRVLVMASGRVIETGSVTQILNAPKQRYTQTLLASVPVLMR